MICEDTYQTLNTFKFIDNTIILASTQQLQSKLDKLVPALLVCAVLFELYPNESSEISLRFCCARDISIRYTRYNL